MSESKGIPCHLIELDYLSLQGRLSWTDAGSFHVSDHLGHIVAPADFKLIWWRRFHLDQRPSALSLTDIQRDVVNNDCRAAVIGGLLATCEAIWVSDPNKQRTAENKIVQLDAARRVGLRVPDTIISNDPDSVRAFCRKHDLH